MLAYSLSHKGILMTCLAAVLVVGLSLAAPSPAVAGDNIAIGDIAGIGADLDSSAVFTLNSLTLALVKTAFLTNGTQLTSGDTVPKGTLVDFLIYVDNSTAVPMDSVNVSDTLDPLAFVYQPGTIRMDTTQVSTTGEGALWTSAEGQTALFDAVNGVDEAGITGNVISAGDGAGNKMVTVPAGKVWAMLFTVKMQ